MHSKLYCLLMESSASHVTIQYNVTVSLLSNLEWVHELVYKLCTL